MEPRRQTGYYDQRSTNLKKPTTIRPSDPSVYTRPEGSTTPRSSHIPKAPFGAGQDTLYGASPAELTSQPRDRKRGQQLQQQLWMYPELAQIAQQNLSNLPARNGRVSEMTSRHGPQASHSTRIVSQSTRVGMNRREPNSDIPTLLQKQSVSIKGRTLPPKALEVVDLSRDDDEPSKDNSSDIQQFDEDNAHEAITSPSSSPQASTSRLPPPPVQREARKLAAVIVDAGKGKSRAQPIDVQDEAESSPPTLPETQRAERSPPSVDPVRQVHSSANKVCPAGGVQNLRQKYDPGIGNRIHPTAAQPNPDTSDDFANNLDPDISFGDAREGPTKAQMSLPSHRPPSTQNRMAPSKIIASAGPIRAKQSHREAVNRIVDLPIKWAVCEPNKNIVASQKAKLVFKASPAEWDNFTIVQADNTKLLSFRPDDIQKCTLPCKDADGPVDNFWIAEIASAGKRAYENGELEPMSRTLCILFDGKNQDFEFKVYIRLYRSLDTRYGAASKLNQVQFIDNAAFSAIFRQVRESAVQYDASKRFATNLASDDRTPVVRTSLLTASAQQQQLKPTKIRPTDLSGAGQPAASTEDTSRPRQSRPRARPSEGAKSAAAAKRSGSSSRSMSPEVTVRATRANAAQRPPESVASEEFYNSGRPKRITRSRQGSTEFVAAAPSTKRSRKAADSASDAQLSDQGQSRLDDWTALAKPTKRKAWVSIGGGSPDEVVLVYPPDGTGSISVTAADYDRLQPDEFLNDTLIEYGMRRIWEDINSDKPELGSQIHIFSSFFFKKLDYKAKNRSISYDSVRKWTSKFDLFSKKYVFIPINENFHWYLAVIVNPGRILRPPMEKPRSEGSPAKRGTPKKGRKAKPQAAKPDAPQPSSLQVTSRFFAQTQQKAGNPEKSADLAHSDEGMALDELDKGAPGKKEEKESRESPSDEDTESSPSTTDELPDEQDIDEALAQESAPLSTGHIADKDDDEDDEIASAVGDEAVLAQISSPSANATALLEQLEDERCYIIVLDSLRGTHRNVSPALREYLHAEAKDKKGLTDEQIWTGTDNVKGIGGRCSMQHNFSDCGLYVLHFTEKILQEREDIIPWLLISKLPAAIDTVSKNLRTSDEQIDAIWSTEAARQRRNELALQIQGEALKWRIRRDEAEARKVQRRAERAERRLELRGQAIASGTDGEAALSGESSDDEHDSDGEIEIITPARKKTPSPKKPPAPTAAPRRSGRRSAAMVATSASDEEEEEEEKMNSGVAADPLSIPASEPDQAKSADAGLPPSAAMRDSLAKVSPSRQPPVDIDAVEPSTEVPATSTEQDVKRAPPSHRKSHSIQVVVPAKPPASPPKPPLAKRSVADDRAEEKQREDTTLVDPTERMSLDESPPHPPVERKRQEGASDDVQLIGSDSEIDPSSPEIRSFIQREEAITEDDEGDEKTEEESDGDGQASHSAGVSRMVDTSPLKTKVSITDTSMIDDASNRGESDAEGNDNSFLFEPISPSSVLRSSQQEGSVDSEPLMAADPSRYLLDKDRVGQFSPSGLPSIPQQPVRHSTPPLRNHPPGIDSLQDTSRSPRQREDSKRSRKLSTEAQAGTSPERVDARSHKKFKYGREVPLNTNEHARLLQAVENYAKPESSRRPDVRSPTSSRTEEITMIADSDDEAAEGAASTKPFRTKASTPSSAPASPASNKISRGDRVQPVPSSTTSRKPASWAAVPAAQSSRDLLTSIINLEEGSSSNEGAYARPTVSPRSPSRNRPKPSGGIHKYFPS